MPTLNIKDPEVYRLAAELARRRGTSMTRAVRDALSESVERSRVERGDPEERARRVLEIAAQMRASSDDPPLTDADLYDERGLPR